MYVLGNLISVAEPIPSTASVLARNARELQRRSGAAWAKLHGHEELFCEKGVALQLRLRALRAAVSAARV